MSLETLRRLGIDMQELMRNPMLLPDYKRTYMRLQRRLMKGFPIPDELDLSLLGYNSLSERSFRLRGMDRAQLHPGLYAGKSAHIAFTDDVDLACLAMLGRPAKREDRLYTFPVAALADLRFNAVYAPTTNRPLHARITPYTLDREDDIPLESREALAALIQAHQSPSRTERRGR